MEGQHGGHIQEDLAAKAREQSKAVADQAKQTGRAMLDERKTAMALQTEHLADALHQAAHRLRERGDKTLGGYTDWAADGLNHFSHTLADHDVDYLMHRTNEFVRRQPVLFLGGAIAVGIALSRLLKSAAPHEEEAYRTHPETELARPEDVYVAPGTEIPTDVPPPESPRG